MKRFCLLIIITLCITASSCSVDPVPEKLPLSVQSTLNLLQPDPQFVMYLNFKSMRNAEFWQKNVSDSIIAAENNFGGLLQIFKKATGASISDGLDELYYSNSWFGENSIVLKGIFDKQKLDTYISSDTTFKKIYTPDGKEVYRKVDESLHFYFRDNITICASNFMSQLNRMIATTDTSRSGLVSNQDMLKAIDKALYKSNIWMVSNEKMFIRGMLMNFVGGMPPGSEMPDTTETPGKLDVNNLYKHINSFSISTKMDKELEAAIQMECVDEKSADYLRSLMSSMVAFAKLSSAGNKEKEGLNKLLSKVKVSSFKSTSLIELVINEDNINAIKQNNPFSAPPPVQ